MKRSQKTRVLSLILALALSLSLCPTALADLDPSDYSDLKEDYWAYDSIMYCSEWEIVKGYDDGKFYPENPVAGVEFVTMVTRTFYADEVAAAQAEKPAEAPWYWANTKVAEDKFLTTGMTINGSAMNRYDMANVAKNVLSTIYGGILPDSGVHFGLDPRLDNVPSQVKDWDSVPKNRTVAIKTCYATGVITGMSDGKFHGEESMTRAQSCIVITRMLDVINGETPSTPAQPQQPTQPVTPAQPETPQQTGLLANGKEPTVENVMEILDEIKEEYPAGTPWGPKDTPNNHYYNYKYIHFFAKGPFDVSTLMESVGGATLSLTYGCGGFMCMVSERIFGLTGFPAREVSTVKNVRPGDIVVYYEKGGRIRHVGIVTYLEETLDGSFCLGTCDGNLIPDGTVVWSYPIPGAVYATGTALNTPSSRTGAYVRIFTRYPTDSDPADLYKFVVEKDI